jgi:hypothetical protein
MSRHLNSYFHWCSSCWKWVCDCVHCVPLASGVFSEQDVPWSQSYLSSSLELNLAFAAQCHDELSA